MNSKNKQDRSPVSQAGDSRLHGQRVRVPGKTRLPWQRMLLIGGITAIALTAALAYLLPGYDENKDPVFLAARLAQARQLLEDRNFAAAEELAAAIPDDCDQYEPSRVVAGEAATRGGRLVQALNYYAPISRGTSAEALLASYAAGEIYRSQTLLALALKEYAHVLEHDPDNVAVHERTAFLLGVTRQHWQAAQHHLALVRLRAWTLDSLAILSDIERSIEQPAFVAHCVELTPDEPLTLLAQAAEYLYAGQPEQALPVIEKAVQREPALLTAQALLGELLLKQDDAAMARWNAQLPANALELPDIWYVRGMHARRSQKLDIAAGCFAQAVRLAPEFRRATYQLGQMLTQLRFDESAKFVERAKLQAELGGVLDQILASRGQSETAMERAAVISEQLGRLWEAWAWATTASRQFPTASWPLPIVRRLSSQLSNDLPRTMPTANLATDVDLNPFVQKAQAHSWTKVESSSTNPAQLAQDDPKRSETRATDKSTPAASPPAKLTFQLENEAGIDFVYNNGSDPQTAGARMFEQTGGGVAVIDFDNDDWPDLYFTQGSPWKTGQLSPTPDPQFHDCLYRNQHGQRFSDASSQVRIDEPNFSQGVAVGDYDADGFDDILVGNIGPCTLWRNNGDGTFTDTSVSLGAQSNTWTTSVLLADLNRDSICDIFKVTYLQGADIYTAICNGKGCSPKGFEGQVDEVLLGLGDGTFQLQPGACPSIDSKGMGVVALRLGESRDLSLFVSNDQVANHLLIREKDSAAPIRFQDEALVRGVALNTDGLPMAGMGIAADDIDGNGLLDLLVTNFADEANTLFMQDSPGLFVDNSQTSGMQSASFPYVGWGTQMIDVDWDGDSDLVIVNGHVDDYKAEGGMYEMPAQLFKNVGRGQFNLVSPTEAGNYFAGKYAARALALLDWNRDGRMDFVVSNIGQKASLVTNTTQTSHHFLNLKLVGTRSTRHPIGATVSVRASGYHATKQLTGGSGYQASNEYLMQFGLGTTNQVEELTIDWPSGVTQKLGPLAVDTTLVVVEEDRN